MSHQKRLLLRSAVAVLLNVASLSVVLLLNVAVLLVAENVALNWNVVVVLTYNAVNCIEESFVRDVECCCCCC